MKKIFFLSIIGSMAYSGERNVLVEMFTNSHCSVCPGAHAAIKSHQTTSQNAHRARYIYYHTTFPYSDDQLSVANTTEPNARNSYYNGPTSTPNTFFDGVNQGRTYSSFATSLDARLSVDSPLEIQLSGTKNGTNLSLIAAITQTSTIAQNDLVVHIVGVENVSYVGRNGVSPQDFVMRKMITPVAGESFTPELQAKKLVLKTAQITNATDMEKVGIVVFVQSVSTKEVFQSEYISYGTLSAVQNNNIITPTKFLLEQNYPNPFNPTTTINYALPKAGNVVLKVYDVLGKEVTTLVSNYQESGRYSVEFDASKLSSGMYIYKLTSRPTDGGQADKFSEVKKMILAK
ncbi:MAG: T9SS type A sorting domain-containing protein [Bacteroidota bacterium]|nr:T9SS type A sorting domain-containing protein [Bacteroidota bacterium]